MKLYLSTEYRENKKHSRNVDLQFPRMTKVFFLILCTVIKCIPFQFNVSTILRVKFESELKNSQAKPNKCKNEKDKISC